MGSGNKLQSQKTAPWSLGERKKQTRKTRVGGRGWEKAQACTLERATLSPLWLEGIYVQVSQEDPSSTFVSFPGVFFQVKVC